MDPSTFLMLLYYFHCDILLDREKLDGVVNTHTGLFHFNIVDMRMLEVDMNNYRNLYVLVI